MPLDSANRCPRCNCADLRVTHTRHVTIKWAGKTRNRLKRRRMCRHCGYIINTVEMTEEELIEAEVTLQDPDYEESDL